MWKRATAVGLACLALGACSPKPGDLARVDSLAPITTERMCGFVDRSTVRKAFDVDIDRANGDEQGKGMFRTVSCTYGSTKNQLAGAQTSVSRTFTGIQRSLDDNFRKLDDEVGDYREVDGLGDGAAFGTDPVVGDQLLVVVLSVNSIRIEAIVRGDRDTTLKQVTPLAKELINGLKSALR